MAQSVSFLQIPDSSNASTFCPAQSGLWLLLTSPHIISHFFSHSSQKPLMGFEQAEHFLASRTLKLLYPRFGTSPPSSTDVFNSLSFSPQRCHPQRGLHPSAPQLKGPPSVPLYLTTLFYFVQRTAPWRQRPECLSPFVFPVAGSISICRMYAPRTKLESWKHQVNQTDPVNSLQPSDSPPFSLHKSHFLFHHSRPHLSPHHLTSWWPQSLLISIPSILSIYQSTPRTVRAWGDPINSITFFHPSSKPTEIDRG